MFLYLSTYAAIDFFAMSKKNISKLSCLCEGRVTVNNLTAFVERFSSLKQFPLIFYYAIWIAFSTFFMSYLCVGVCEWGLFEKVKYKKAVSNKKSPRGFSIYIGFRLNLRDLLSVGEVLNNWI